MSGESTGRLPTSPVMQSERAFCDTRYKRLEAGTFQLPTVASQEQGIELDASQLAHLLGGLDLRTGRRRKRYRRADKFVRQANSFNNALP